MLVNSPFFNRLFELTVEGYTLKASTQYFSSNKLNSTVQSSVFHCCMGRVLSHDVKYNLIVFQLEFKLKALK